jgi:DNA-binding beta-propeller fold protein YncE
MRTFKQLLWILCLNSVVVFAASTDKEHYIFERLWPTLPQPWHFDRAYDLAVDQQGNVYVANQGTHLLQKFTSNGHFIHQWHFANNIPIDIEISKTGNIYVLYEQKKTAELNDMTLIRVMTPDGKWICEWGEKGRNGECAGTSTPEQKNFKYNLNNYSIAVDNSDHVYLFQDYYKFEQQIVLQKFTAEGELVRKWPIRAPISKEYLDVDIAISSDNALYIAYQADDTILKYQIKDKAITLEREWHGFKRPEDITLDREDNLYVVDRGNAQIVRKLASSDEFEPFIFNQQFDIRIPTLEELGNYPLNFLTQNEQAYSSFINVLPEFDRITQQLGDIFQIGQELSEVSKELFFPWSIAVWDPKDKISITTHAIDNSVQQYDSEGQFITEWIDRSSNDGRFYAPFDIARDSQGYLYVTDALNHRVLKFTENGQLIHSWGKAGMKRGEFAIPTGITVDQADNIYVADTGNLRIQKFNSQGKFLNQWLGIADPEDLPIEPNERLKFLLEESDFLFPNKVVLDREGNIYVLDVIRNKVVKMTESGEIDQEFAQSQLALGLSGQGKGEFKTPLNMTIDRYDNIYVLDTYNHRIQQFTKKGNYVDQWGQLGKGPCEFHEPFGITNDAEGYFYVVDNKSSDLKSKGRIQKLKLIPNEPCQFITQWGEFGSFPGQFGDSYGLTVTPHGERVFLADMKFHRIQVFKQGIFNEGKAIIVAGGGPKNNDLWSSTQTAANFAYRTLAYQGFTKETMYYLSDTKNFDLDGNGENDDIDEVHTKANFKNAITEWAFDAENLTLYFTDHGAIETFSLNDFPTTQESLVQATELAEWLKIWHDKHPNGILKVIYDACYSGSFIDALSAKNRIIITSSTADQEANFVSQGALSFSNSFWTHIFNGLNIKTAFEQAQETVAKGFSIDNLPTQTPEIWHEFENIAHLYIGNGTQIESEAPVISHIDFSPVMDGKVSIRAEVSDDDAIDKVWAVIIPPHSFGDNSRTLESSSTGETILELPSCDFQKIAKNYYQTECEEFKTKGHYNVAIYARDSAQNISIPKIKIISNKFGRNRKAIIVVAGSENTLPQYQKIAEKTKQVYEALRYQGYGTNDIQYLVNTSVSINESTIMQANSFNLLEGTLKGWAIDNTEDLVLYIVGLGDKNGIVLKNDDILSFSELKEALDELQNGVIPGPVTVIYEGPQSSYLLPALALEKGLSDKKRFLISSASHDLSQNEGFSAQEELLKFYFSELFWEQISNGTQLSLAFHRVDKTFPIEDLNKPQFDKNDHNSFLKTGYTIGIGIKKALQPRKICLYQLDKSTSCQIGDQLQVILPKQLDNQIRYIGIQLPNKQLFLIRALNELVPFEGIETLPVWKGNHQRVVDIEIEQMMPKGEYRFYWLDIPKDRAIDRSSISLFLKESILDIK